MFFKLKVFLFFLELYFLIYNYSPRVLQFRRVKSKSVWLLLQHYYWAGNEILTFSRMF